MFSAVELVVESFELVVESFATKSLCEFWGPRAGGKAVGAHP